MHSYLKNSRHLLRAWVRKPQGPASLGLEFQVHAAIFSLKKKKCVLGIKLRSLCQVLYLLSHFPGLKDHFTNHIMWSKPITMESQGAVAADPESHGWLEQQGCALFK